MGHVKTALNLIDRYAALFEKIFGGRHGPSMEIDIGGYPDRCGGYRGGCCECDYLSGRSGLAAILIKIRRFTIVHRSSVRASSEF